jgi:hypothetical protein
MKYVDLWVTQPLLTEIATMKYVDLWVTQSLLTERATIKYVYLRVTQSLLTERATIKYVDLWVTHSLLTANRLLPQEQCFGIFIMFFFPSQQQCDRDCFFHFSPLKILRYGSKNCWSCRKFLLLLSTERSGWCTVFWLLVNPWICEAAKYEPAKMEGWMYYEMNLMTWDVFVKKKKISPYLSIELCPLLTLKPTTYCPNSNSMHHWNCLPIVSNSRHYEVSKRTCMLFTFWHRSFIFKF